MRKEVWVALLFVLLIAGVIADRYPGSWQHEASNTSVQVTAPFQPQYTINEYPQSSVDLTAKLCGISQFQKWYKTTGAGQRIALIDSGIDLGHRVFQMTEKTGPKVIAYRDYTEEGKLETYAAKLCRDGLTAGGTVYRIGDIPNNAETYRLAFLDLHTVQPRLLTKSEKVLGVLVTARNSSGYNCVYVDVNQNCDFTDEIPLYQYEIQNQSLTLPASSGNLNLALTSISSDGRYLQLTADTLGHGTFLAGLMAGNSVGYQGLAPEAELYVYKIFNRDGEASQQKLAQAIGQAVLDGVDCINLSLSIPKTELAGTELQEVLKQAEEADIPVIAAAGNYGPGKNTITWPAKDTSVIAIGSYSHPAQYRLDRNIFLEEPFIADYSGRGGLDGEVLLVAPSGMISTVPGWYGRRCMFDYGTSISAAITTAAICHVREASEQKGLSLSVEQLKNQLSRWAKDTGASASEQGYGALYLGKFPQHSERILPRNGLKEERLVYTKDDRLLWTFTVPQGQSQSWYVEVPSGSAELSAVLQVEQQMPQNSMEHVIAMGRCYISLYSPDGVLMDQSPYLGASYNEELVVSDAVGAILPQPGIWEIVVTSADDLSQYNHLESSGTLKAKLK